MNGERNLNPQNLPGAFDKQASVSDILADIKAEFDVVMGSPVRVQAACEKLRACWGVPAPMQNPKALKALLPLLAGHAGPMVMPLFDLLNEAIETVDDPWPLLEGMLASRDPKLIDRTLKRILSLAQEKQLVVDRRIAACFAEQVEIDGSCLRDPKRLQVLAQILRYFSASAHTKGIDPLTDLYCQAGERKLRRLAARLLDLDGIPPADHLAQQIIGTGAHQFLAPYLAYTRATHLDLLDLSPIDGQPPPFLPDLQSAETLCGRPLLQTVIAELGWGCVNFGLSVRKYIRMTVGNSFPLLLLPTEASLLDTFDQTRRVDERFLFVAHGGPFDAGAEADLEQGPVARFKAYNLTQAEVLAELLSLTPLSRKKIRRILDGMDRLVEDFTQLFSGFDPDCKWLSGTYGKLRTQIMSELRKQTADLPLSAKLTRLVQMFQDPKSLAEVQTLHGLKRYLHQRGLQLGFRLVESNRGTNRNVSLVTASPEAILQQYRGIHYVDFEPQVGSRYPVKIPYTVRLVAEGFGRQMLYDHEGFPGVNAFCYGNEVHYYLSFLTHPAFLRIDYSPPLQGGMIDLEYYGVSKNELELHPNLSLDAIQQFFLDMEFDINVEMTHIHARYDKERAPDLGDLCQKAAALFCLAPYMMEIDWAIGSLALSIEARHAVAKAWAQFFAHWGVLPLRQMLTRDGKGILVERIHGPVGDQERTWSGEGPYRDRFSSGLPDNFLNALRDILLKAGLEIDPLSGTRRRDQFGQVRIEQAMLLPLRNALESGEVIETPAGLAPAPKDIFQVEWPAEKFAEILSANDQSITAAASLAQLIATLEPGLKFQTTGALNGYAVQYAPLVLPGESLCLYVLRDQEGIIRLALFSRQRSLYRCRRRAGLDWASNASLDFAELASLLRRSNYLSSGTGAVSEIHRDVAADLCARFRTTNPAQPATGLPGENVLTGVKVSPGRCAGTVVFGTAGRNPEEVTGAILITPSIRPEDNAFLYHAAGVVSTGGGILSHAGLTAIQFRKPALMISARWHQGAQGLRELHYDIEEYQLQEKEAFGCRLSMRVHRYRKTHRLNEGDLAVLDAGQGTLTVLGHDPDVLALYSALQHLGAASLQLVEADDPGKIMALRGRRLRCRYQIEKLLERTADPAAIRYMVHEILISEYLSSHGGCSSEKAQLLAIILHNQNVGKVARESLSGFAHQLNVRHAALYSEIQRRVPVSTDMYEILFLRIKLLRIDRTLREVRTLFQNCGVETFSTRKLLGDGSIDALVRKRIGQIRDLFAGRLLFDEPLSETDYTRRFRVRQIQHLDRVIHTPGAQRKTLEDLNARIAAKDRQVLERIKTQPVLLPGSCGFEAFPLIGWKAANLAEVERLAGPGRVPPWFVVTDRAFKEMLDLVPGKNSWYTNGANSPASVRERIEEILSRRNLNNIQKSSLIRRIWEEIVFPREIAVQIVAGYHKLVDNAAQSADFIDGGQEIFVAVRSSAREEDNQTAARAGEFDTFLFIRGENELLQHLKMAWSGLWTERAIHNRALFQMDAEFPGGGVIVQKIVHARVSGVLQTVNVAEENLQEMVVNAGLGLGEGIVSGMVAADHILVDKQTLGGDGPLRFRYVIADKQRQVVFNQHSGQGTRLVKTLYHQRLRAALEYVEIKELADIANQLERAYGYPLDIEFAIEGTRLWILQARPVATFMSTLQETLQHYPLQA